MAEQDYACVGRGCQRAAMQTEIERLRKERDEYQRTSAGYYHEAADALDKFNHTLRCLLDEREQRKSHLDTIDRLRAALEWLRGWRMKDHEAIDCTIQHALGEAETCTVCYPHGNAALAGGNGDERHG